MEYSGRDTTEEARHEATSIKHGGKQDMDMIMTRWNFLNLKEKYVDVSLR